MITVRHPPGRAGRLWLRQRLAVAEAAGDQLGRKLRVLLQEHARLLRLREEEDLAWSEAVARARRWQLRAGVLSGQSAYAGGVPVERVQLRIRWTSVVGVTIPSSPERVGPQPSPPGVVANTAVLAATDAFNAALKAGGDLAMATEAVHRIEAELALTRRRVRALERRWIPALLAELAAIEQSLELDEQEEGGRLRRALAGAARGDGADFG